LSQTAKSIFHKLLKASIAGIGISHNKIGGSSSELISSADIHLISIAEWPIVLNAWPEELSRSGLWGNRATPLKEGDGAPEAHHKALDLSRKFGLDVEYWPTADPTIVESNREQRLDAYREVRDQLMRRVRRRFGAPDAGNE
jgi:hypothetical protein